MVVDGAGGAGDDGAGAGAGADDAAGGAGANGGGGDGMERNYEENGDMPALYGSIEDKRGFRGEI